MPDSSSAPAAQATATSTPASSAPTSSTPGTSAAPASEPGTSAPPKATDLATLKAERREKAKAATPPPAAAPAAVPVEAPKPATGTATIEMDAADLKQFSTLSRELREARAKVKELDGKVQGFGKFEKAQALAKEGKHYDAAREAGIDVDAALAELLGQNNGNPTAGQIDRKLIERLEAVEAKETEREKAEKEQKAKETAKAIEAEKSVTAKFVADNAAKYPFLAKSPKLVDLAYRDFEDARGKAEADEGRPLTDNERSRLLLAALSVHEEDWGKTLGAKTEDKPGEVTAAGLDAAVRAGVRQPAELPKKKLTFDELKAERMAKRRTA